MKLKGDTRLFRENEGSHWYWPDGCPCYTVPNKSKPGEQRKASLKDAKKLGLLPSVTTILKILDKPTLDNWRCEMAVIAALTLPMRPDETTDQYAKRVAEDADTMRTGSAGFGHDVHQRAEEYCKNVMQEIADPMPVTEGHVLYDHMCHFNEWFKKNITKVFAVESVLVDPNGRYAGMRDLFANHIKHGLVTIDFKSQKFRNREPEFYDEWSYQLAAYDRACDMETTLMNVAINSTDALPLVEYAWNEKETEKANRVWPLLTELWYELKEFQKPSA